MIDLVLCASGADEVQLVSLISTELTSQVRVVRRCADLAEALAVTDSGLGDAVIVDVDVSGLERSNIHTFLSHGVPVIALESGHSRRSASDIGLSHTVSAQMSADDLYTILIEVVATAQDQEAMSAWDTPETEEQPQCPLITVWGPSGGPGRSFVASNVAWEMARRGRETLLVDADTVGPSLSQALGVIDEAPGIVAACRAALKGTLREDALNSLTPYVTDHLRLLSGIGVPSRWSEVHMNALEQVYRYARTMHDFVIADISAHLEASSQATPGLERHGASLVSLTQASHVLGVVQADPVSITRFIREAETLREITQAPLTVVVNRSYTTVSLSHIERSLRSRLDLGDVLSVPLDPNAVSRATWDGTLVCEAAPRSDSAKALAAIAALLSGSVLGST